MKNIKCKLKKVEKKKLLLIIIAIAILLISALGVTNELILN